jgi:hypothetical protein
MLSISVFSKIVIQRATSCIFFLVVTGVAAAANPPLQLQSDTEVAAAGYYQLSWEQGDKDVRLVESRDPAFSDRTVVYAGADTARLVSGKPDGEYYYRLEALPGERVLSNTLEVSVQHHSLRRAWAFFSIGAVVFLATLALIVAGGRAAAVEP